MSVQKLMRVAIYAGMGISLLCVPCSPAFAAGKGGGLLSGIFGSFFVKKDRPFLDVRSGLSMYREEDSYPDTVLGIELNAALSRYVNVEVGVGGYHEHLPYYVWNGFLSYVVAGAAYTMTSMSGKNDSFNGLRDPMLLEKKHPDNPYYNTAVSGGVFLVPFPSLRIQPQVGMHVMRLQVRNKGSSARSVDDLKVMPSFGLERRGEEIFSGGRLFLTNSGSQTYVGGLKVYYGVEL